MEIYATVTSNCILPVQFLKIKILEIANLENLNLRSNPNVDPKYGVAYKKKRVNRNKTLLSIDMLRVKYADLRNYPDPFTSISREFRDFERICLNFPRVQEKSDTKKVHKFRILCFYSYVLLYSN